LAGYALKRSENNACLKWPTHYHRGYPDIIEQLERREMMTVKRKIEIFSAGCGLSEETINMV
jgi:hypothetical protein